MIESIPFLISGIVFGLAAGISPGPLLTLVVAETLKHSKKEGIFIAMAPLLTDIPIVFVSIFVISRLSNSDIILGIIALIGAVFIGYLGYESMTIKGIKLGQKDIRSQSLKKGIITNFLSPHPYIFWIAVGAPTVLKAFNVNVASSVFFVIGFYALLVGSKIIVALITDKSKIFLKSNIYISIIRILGIALFVFAVIFIKDGFKLLGIL